MPGKIERKRRYKLDVNIVNSFPNLLTGYLKEFNKFHWLQSWQYDSWKLNLKACIN